MSRYTLDTSARSVVGAIVLQGFGFASLFVPLTTVALAHIPRYRLTDATGLNSLLRQIGGSLGLAAFATLAPALHRHRARGARRPRRRRTAGGRAAAGDDAGRPRRARARRGPTSRPRRSGSSAPSSPARPPCSRSSACSCSRASASSSSYRSRSCSRAPRGCVARAVGQTEKRTERGIPMERCPPFQSRFRPPKRRFRTPNRPPPRWSRSRRRSPRAAAARPFLILGIVAARRRRGRRGLSPGRRRPRGAPTTRRSRPTSCPSRHASGARWCGWRWHENQLVQRGALLAEIDPADASARVQQAEAELATARAQAAAADAQVQIVEATSQGGLEQRARRAVAARPRACVGANAQLAAARAAVARAGAELRKAELDARARPHARRGERDVPGAAGRRRDRGSSRRRRPRPRPTPRSRSPRRRAAARRAASARRVAASARARRSRPRSRPPGPAPIWRRARAQRRGRAARSRSCSSGTRGSSRPRDGYASKLTAHDGQLVVGRPAGGGARAGRDLRGRQLQGDADRADAAGPARDDRGGRLSGTKVGGAGREPRRAAPAPASRCCPADNATGNFVKVVQRVPVRIALVEPAARPRAARRPVRRRDRRRRPVATEGETPGAAGPSADVTVDVGR